MAWVIYLGGIQDLHPGSESWLAEWGRIVSLSDAKSAIERGEYANLVTLLPHGEEIEAYGSLEQWLRKHPSTHCTLVYPQPALAIAKQLQRGEELEAVCQHWKQQTQSLLSLFRQRRRQLRLLSWPVAAKTSEGESTDQAPLLKHSLNDEIEPIYTLLAHQALAQDVELAEAARYLAASTQNDARCQLAGPGASAILERHRQGQKQQKRDQQIWADKIQTLREERDRAFQHSDELQQSLDQQKKQTHEQRERVEDLQARHDQAQASRQAQEEENVLVLQQLHSVQEELEQALLNRQGVEKQLDEAKSAQGVLEKRLKQTRDQLQVEEGKSSGLKQERDKLNAQRQENEEENALVLQQLHSVQEELEQALLNRQGVEKQLDEAKCAQGALEKRLKQTREQLQVEEGKSSGLKQERDKLNAQRQENEEENTLMLEQLHYVQEELERHILDHRDQESRYTDQQTALTEQVKALQIQLCEQQRAHQQQELLLQWLRAFATRVNCAFYKKRPTVLKEHKALLASSTSFDADWYARTYPDVAESGTEPATHYLKFGMLEGRNPSAEFDTRLYITAHPDIAAAGDPPLLHYIRWGRDEQRQALPKKRDEESP